MALSPEVQNKVAEWRAKAIAGTLSQEEMRDAVALLREDRISVGLSAGKKTSRAKAAPVDADALLSELEGL